VIRIAVPFVLLALTFVAACGEHPCTLHMGEPQFCTATPGDATAPFCQEVCGVCEDQNADRWVSACKAHCRSRAGIEELTCEQLDPTVEAKYRECVETSDAPGCGGDTRHGPNAS
jgi:hypothetical protein